jgi:hypothetical protein
MGSAGLSLAGTQLAGAESLPDLSPPVKRTVLAAILYDPQTKRFDPNTSMHPVDQFVTLALTTAFGSLKSVPKQGLVKPSLRTPGGSLNRRSLDAVRVALKAAIDAGDIELVAVEPIVDASSSGRLILAVTYKNLRINTTPTVYTNAPR